MTDDKKQRVTVDDILGPEFKSPAGGKAQQPATATGLPAGQEPAPQAAPSGAPASPPAVTSGESERPRPGQSGAPLPPVPGTAPATGHIPSAPATETRVSDPVALADAALSDFPKAEKAPAAAPNAEPAPRPGQAPSGRVAPALPEPATGAVSVPEPAAVPIPDTGVVSQDGAWGGSAATTPPSVEQDNEVPLGAPAAMPPFPKAETRAAIDAMVAWVRAWPQNMKIIIGASAGGLLLALLVLAIVSLGSGVEEAFVLSSHHLIQVPLADDRFTVRQVERGELVEVHERQGDFALIRNEAGRVGWIRSAHLGDLPLPVTADEPFSMCERRWTETDGEACKARAMMQNQACEASCESADEFAACLRACEDRLSACNATCALIPGEAPAPALDLAEPDLGVPPAPDLGTPAEEGEPVVEPEPVPEPTKVKKRKRRKKKRRKKR